MVRKKVIHSHCRRGHSLNQENLHPRRLENGKRECFACSKARSYIRKNPHLTDEIQKISDEFY